MTAQQRSKSADRKNGLNGTFSKRVLVTNNDCAAVILECSRENLAGRSALAAGQNDQRSGISNACVGVGRDPDAAVVILGLNNRARLQKQTCERERFLQ